MKAYYEVLGLSKNSTMDQIKSAYRTLAFKYHPDKNPNDENAENMFKDINEAYSILSDENKRRDYDSNLKTDYSKGNDYSSSDAMYQFLNTMYAYASEMTMNNISSRDIAKFLRDKGCPDTIAQSIAVSLEKQRKAMVRNEAKALLVKSILSLIGGFIFTAISYNIGEARYFVFYGLILYGLWNGIRGLYYIATGNVPTKKKKIPNKDNENRVDWNIVAVFSAIVVVFIVFTIASSSDNNSGAQESYVKIEQELNIRDGPGTQFEVIAVYRPGSIATVLGYSDNWIKVGFELNSVSLTGWINKKYTTRY